MRTRKQFSSRRGSRGQVMTEMQHGWKMSETLLLADFSKCTLTPLRARSEIFFNVKHFCFVKKKKNFMLKIRLLHMTHILNRLILSAVTGILHQLIMSWCSDTFSKVHTNVRTVKRAKSQGGARQLEPGRRRYRHRFETASLLCWDQLFNTGLTLVKGVKKKNNNNNFPPHLRGCSPLKTPAAAHVQRPIRRWRWRRERSAGKFPKMVWEKNEASAKQDH